MAKKTTKSAKRKVPAKTSTRKTRAIKAKSAALKKVDKPSIVSEEPSLNTRPKLPSVFQLAKSSVELVWENRKLFLAICVTYGLLNLILVQGLANSSSVSNLKTDITKGFNGHPASLASSVGVFSELLTSAGNSSSQTAGAYQIFLFLIISLAIIWTLRQVVAGKKIRMREAFYQGITPLIPFILVLIMFCIQLIPLVIGSALYGIAVSSGVAITLLEKILFLMVFALFLVWSFYLLSSTIFAVYIVTLPEMTPLKALRSAKQLVNKRRLLLIRKIIGLPIVLVIAAAIIMVPIILIATSLAQWVFFILTTITLLMVHTYMYSLYRELLNE